MENIELALQLDQLRRERKVTVEQMCKGVISRRNYSRLLSGEVDIQVDVLSKLLINLKVPLEEFSWYRFNRLMFKNIDEVNFHEVMRYGNIEKAAKEYPGILTKHTLGSVYAKKAVPLDILLVKHHLGMITKDDLLSQARIIIDMKSYAKSYIVQDDDVEALYAYSKICREDELLPIIQFEERAIFSGKIKLFTNFVEVAIILNHLTLMQALLRKKEMTPTDHNLFKCTVNSGLEFLQRSKLMPFDFMFFNLYKKYCDKYAINNPYVTFYYYAAIESSNHPEFADRAAQFVTKKDRDVYLSCLNDETIRKGVIYEKVFFDELL